MKHFLAFLIMLSFVLAPTDTFCQPKPDVNAFGVLKNGQQEPVAKIIVQEFLTTKFFAMLNYVFFEQDSYELPRRYNLFETAEETKRFNPESQFLNYEILDVYYHVLNIIGYRLKNNPAASVTLVGCNSNYRNEKGNIDLSLKRAETVRNYLVDIWQIEPERVKLGEPRNLPERASDSKSEPMLSVEENRRVEIYGDWDLLKPLVINDTLRSSNPPTIYFSTKIESQSPIKTWKLTIMQKGKDLRRPFRGRKKPDRRIAWRINKYKDQMPSGNLPIIYRLYATSNLKGSSPLKRLPVEQLSVVTKKKKRLKSKEYSRYNLILFDFNRNKLGDNNLNILNMIRENEKIDDSTKFYVSGYTDYIGTDEINMKLSNKRADETANQLSKLGVKPEQIFTQGLGKSSSPYFQSAIEKLTVADGKYIDPEYGKFENVEEEENTGNYNKSPEGRFYLRTVVVEIENQVDYEDK